MIDDKTTELQLPLPHPDNQLEQDVIRLRQALAEIDGAMAAVVQALAVKADADDLLDLVGINDPRLTDARTPTAHTHAAAQISDATAIGRAVLVAATQAAARSAIGASNFTGSYADLAGKPAPPDLSGKLDRIGGTTKGVTASYRDKGTISSGSVLIDFADAECQRVQAGGDITLALGWPASGMLAEVLLEAVNFGGKTITWPALRWVKADGSKTTIASSNGITWQTAGVDFVLIWTRDGGATTYAKVMR